MRYVKARQDEADRVDAYRIYVTDVLKVISNRDLPRYYDLMNPPPEPTETAEEITKRIKSGLNKLGGGIS